MGGKSHKTLYHHTCTLFEMFTLLWLIDKYFDYEGDTSQSEAFTRRHDNLKFANSCWQIKGGTSAKPGSLKSWQTVPTCRQSCCKLSFYTECNIRWKRPDVNANRLFVTCSDQMGNKGAFITMGPDMKPNFTTYDAVVSSVFFVLYCSTMHRVLWIALYLSITAFCLWKLVQCRKRSWYWVVAIQAWNLLFCALFSANNCLRWNCFPHHHGQWATD